MKLNSIFIDLSNAKQVKWWNTFASKLVKVVKYDCIVETATGKQVGVIIMVSGLLKNVVIRLNNRFLTNTVTKVVKG